LLAAGAGLAAAYAPVVDFDGVIHSYYSAARRTDGLTLTERLMLEDLDREPMPEELAAESG
jgi:hypothetical protein